MEVSTILTLQTVPESGRYKNDRIQNGLDYNSFLIDKLANDQIDPEDRDAVIGNHFKLFLDMLKENLFKMWTAANTAIDKGNVYWKFPTHKVIRK